MNTNSRVYVGGLSRDVRERDVEEFFQGYGRIKDIALKNGFCFVELSNQRDADDAIRDLDNRRLLGRRVVVQNSRKPRGMEQNFRRSRLPQRNHRFSPARRTNFRVTVENLSTRVQWQELKDFLKKVGKVTYAKAHNLCPNQGMAEFETYDDMKKAIDELNGAELNGRKIVIKETSSLSKSRSPSGGRPRSLPRCRSPVTFSTSPEKEIENLGKRSRENSEERSEALLHSPKKRCSRSRSPSNEKIF